MSRFHAFWRRLCAVSMAGFLTTVLTVESTAATLPPGFTETLVASGLSSPTAMQFAPDGRIFVCQQGGALRVIQNGAFLPTPFVTIAVDPSGERGLLGVAFDPDFASNQFVYVYYTVPAGPGVTAHNRISRFTASGNVAVAGSEVPLVELDNLSGATNHNGGAINFGPDGKLYVAVGDNANTSFPQSLSTRHGKMLRYNADGSIPADNPTSFPGIAGTTSGLYRAIWAVGLRNPFTFALNPGGSPGMMINDVGQGSWEEANAGAAAANYGYPATEGDFNPATQPNFTRPRYAYANDASTCAITGGAFYNPASATFPGSYSGTYFFADFCAGWIKYVDPTIVQPFPLQASAATTFATGISSPVDLKVWSDGALYYLARGAGSIFRVQYGSSAPTIASQPTSRTVTVGQAATFSVTASGTAPFTYQWQRNGVDIGGATSTSYTLSNAQLSDSGATFRVNVANGFGNVFSASATLTVTANQPPVATITAPSAALRYAGGMTVAFAGTGSDPEDGTRPPSAFTWQVDFHHDTHSHPFFPATSGMTSGSFVIPTTGETSANVWYRVFLTVTDSTGRSTTVQRDIHPQVVRLTVAASPSALQVGLDGQSVSSPTSVDSVVGVERSIAAATFQTVSGVTYTFASWSDGGAAVRIIQTPSVDTTYTAAFTAVAVTGVPTPPTALVATVNGGTVHLAWQRGIGAQGYRLDVGSRPGEADLVSANVGDVVTFQALAPPGTYYVRVRSVNAVGVSGPSNQATVTVTTSASCVSPPPVPQGLTVQTGGLVAALAWTPAAGATGYRLEAGRAPGAVETSVPLGNVSTFQTVGPAGSFYARVRAVNACGDSAPSTSVPLTLACGPGAVVPANLVSGVTGGAVTFAWLRPLGATGYRLQPGTTPGASDVAEVAIGPESSWTSSLAGVPRRTYYVRVRAVSACGVGAASNEISLLVP